MALPIVVDTDVVRAAGISSGAANQAAQVLSAIRAGGFIVAISDELESEWLKKRTAPSGEWAPYISVLAFNWYTLLHSTGRLTKVKTNPKVGELLLQAVPASHRRRRRELEKDLPAILTALAADRRLISNNRRERKTLAGTCAKTKRLLAGFLWPYPLAAALVWLEAGANDVPEHRVCES